MIDHDPALVTALLFVGGGFFAFLFGLALGRWERAEKAETLKAEKLKRGGQEV